MAVVGSDVTGNITTNGQAVTATANPWDQVVIQLTGTWTGTVQFEATLDGTTWFALALGAVATPNTVTVVSATANGTWVGGCSPYSQVRVRASAAMTGTLAVRVAFGDTL